MNLLVVSGFPPEPVIGRAQARPVGGNERSLWPAHARPYALHRVRDARYGRRYACRKYGLSLIRSSTIGLAINKAPITKASTTPREDTAPADSARSNAA